MYILQKAIVAHLVDGNTICYTSGYTRDEMMDIWSSNISKLIIKSQLNSIDDLHFYEDDFSAFDWT